MTDPAALPEVEARLPAGARLIRNGRVDILFSWIVGGPSRDGRIKRMHILYGGATRMARTASREELLSVLAQSLKYAVAETARDRVFVHAGVVGWRGRAILLPGVSQTGKSRLVEALVRAGATYYSDEYAVLDDRGRVHPYLQPLQRRGDDGTITHIPPDDLGRTGRGPLAVGLVALAPYRKGGRWRPRRLSPGRGALAMLANTVVARPRPKESLRALQRVVRRAVVVAGPRGAAEETAASLLAELERRAPRR